MTPAKPARIDRDMTETLPDSMTHQYSIIAAPDGVDDMAQIRAPP